MFDLTHDLKVKPFIETANQWLGGVPQEGVDTLWEYLQFVFATWKNEHGNREQSGPGLLSPAFNDDFSFEDAEPYQCAGLGVRNNIDLFLKLWVEKYPPVMNVLDKVSLPLVLCVLVVKEPKPGWAFESIAHAMNIVHDLDREDKKFAWDQLAAVAPDVKRGKKVFDSAKRGHEAVYGTAEEKEAERQRIRKECQAVRKQQPTWGLTSIRGEVAERLGISFKTVQRATPDLRELIGRKH